MGPPRWLLLYKTRERAAVRFVMENIQAFLLKVGPEKLVDRRESELLSNFFPKKIRRNNRMHRGRCGVREVCLCAAHRPLDEPLN